MKLRSLFLAVAGALILTAALAPRANAAVIVYYNFEDATLGGPVDFTAEAIGSQTPILMTDYNLASTFTVAGFTDNAVPNPPNTDPNVLGMGLSRSSMNDPSNFFFHVDTTFLTNMSLSFAINTAGNGFEFVTLQYSLSATPTTFVNFGGPFMIASSTPQIISAMVPMAAQGDPDVIFRLHFTGGQSNGTNLQNTIDNILLGGTIIPEPATVVSGLLGALGLCWHQRRRLIRTLRLYRT